MVPPSPPSSVGWGLLGERMLECSIGPTHMCESTCTPHPSQRASPEAARAHVGLIGHLPAALAASASPSPTPCEPSWKTASLMAGGLGAGLGSPQSLQDAPLPQPLLAPAAQWRHHLSSHTCAMRLCTRKHILFLSLLLKHTFTGLHTSI